MTYDEYIAACVRAQETRPEWRWGQTLFNMLYDYRPDLAELVMTTDLDPFYKDDMDSVANFIAFAEAHWKDNE